MGKHAKIKNAENGDSNRNVFEWLKIAGLVAAILVLLGTVGALALLASVSSRIKPVDPEKVRQETAPSKPLAPQNILLLGSDTRGEKHARSDTIIIAHIDTRHKRVTLVSIPRDMRVNIPGHGLDKINAAMFYGGPPLTIKTVRQFTGLPINHYAQVDFNGFKELVNALGGVWIRVEKDIDDPEAGPPIKAGYQHLFGKTALAYCRTRKSANGDYDRIAHQQKFFAALLEQSNRFQTIFRIPELINIFAENVETDMTLGEMSQLAVHMRSIKRKDMEGVTLPGNGQRLSDGLWYELPIMDKITPILARVKKNLPVKQSLESTATAGKKPKPAKPVLPRDITIEVKNGGGPSGSAAQLGRKLNALGYMVSGVGNAKRSDYATTQVVYRDNKAKAAKVESVVGKGQVVAGNGQYKMTTDVLVIVGQDY